MAHVTSVWSAEAKCPFFDVREPMDKKIISKICELRSMKLADVSVKVRSDGVLSTFYRFKGQGLIQHLPCSIMPTIVLYMSFC